MNESEGGVHAKFAGNLLCTKGGLWVCVCVAGWGGDGGLITHSLRYGCRMYKLPNYRAVFAWSVQQGGQTSRKRSLADTTSNP